MGIINQLKAFVGPHLQSTLRIFHPQLHSTSLHSTPHIYTESTLDTTQPGAGGLDQLWTLRFVGKAMPFAPSPKYEISGMVTNPPVVFHDIVLATKKKPSMINIDKP